MTDLYSPPSLPRLGKKPAVYDPRTLSLAKYLTAAPPHLPAVVPSRDWTKEVTKRGSYPMHLNDELGDCVVASMAHQVETWTANAMHAEHTVTDAEVLDFYEALSGYDPSRPETDQGAIMLDGLKLWRKRGLGDHKIGGFVSVDRLSRVSVMQGINIFGGIRIGLQLPVSAKEQDHWDVPLEGARGELGKPGGWGGHAVGVFMHHWDGLACVTWGGVKTMSWAFLKTYCDEAYACFSRDFLNGVGKAPNGLDAAALIDDMRAFK